MSTPVKRARALGLLAVLFVVPGTAFAQTGGVSTPSVTEQNNGIKVGDARLHPYFDLEGRLDTAAGFFGPPGSTNLSSEIIGHFRPGVRLVGSYMSRPPLTPHTWPVM